MPPTDRSLWYTLGRAVESVASAFPGRASNPERPRPAKPSDDPRRGWRGGPSAPGDPERTAYPLGLLAGGATALLGTMLTKRLVTHRPSSRRLARGAVAGAGAAALIFAARELGGSRRADEREDDQDVLDELLGGAGRGLIYAALIDPHLPGGPLLKGVLAGTLDYTLAPAGGLFRSLEPLSPIHRVPVVSALLEVGYSEADPYLAHLCNGILLGLLCGRAPRPIRG